MDVERGDQREPGDGPGPATASLNSPVTKRALASGATSLTMSQAFQFGLRSATAIILARFISPADFGLLGLVSIVTGLFERTVADSGMVNAYVHRAEVSRPLASSIFYFNVAVGVLLAGAIVITAGPLASLLGDPRAADVFRGLAICFAIRSVSKMPEAILRRSFRYGPLALLGSTNAFVTGLVAIPLAVAGHGVSSMVIGAIAGVTVEVIAALALSRFRPQLHFRVSEVRTMTSYSGNYTAFHFVNYFSDAGDKFIVGRFVGQAALGFYAVPYRLVFAPIFAAGQVFRDLFFTVYARKQDEPQAIGRDYIRAVTALAALTFPFAALVSALGSPIVAVVLGPEWTPAGPIVTVMSIVALIQSVLITTGIILTATGRTGVLFRWGIASALIMFTCYTTGLYWGAMGVASGFLVGTVLLTYPAIALPFRYIDASPRSLFRALVPVAFATSVGAAIAVAVRLTLESRGASSFAVATVGVLLGSAGYVGVLILQRAPVLGDVRLFFATRFRRPAAAGANEESL